MFCQHAFMISIIGTWLIRWLQIQHILYRMAVCYKSSKQRTNWLIPFSPAPVFESLFWSAPAALLADLATVHKAMLHYTSNCCTLICQEWPLFHSISCSVQPLFNDPIGGKMADMNSATFSSLAVCLPFTLPWNSIVTEHGTMLPCFKDWSPYTWLGML